MNLHPSQAIIARDRHRFRVLVCGRKFGKTQLTIEEILGVALSKADKEIAYLATNYGEARDIAWARMIKRYEPIFAEKPNETRLEMYLMSQDKGRSHLQLRGWENIETLRGREFDFLVLDETQNYKAFWMYWQEVLRPTLTPRKGTVLFCGTPKGFNHLYDLYNLEINNPEFKSFHFTSYDNPFLDISEIEAAKQTMTLDRFGQEYLAEFTKTEGLVYKEFIRAKHLYEKLPEKKFEKVAGIDFGYVNPAAVLDIRTDSEELWVEDEWYKTGRTETQIAEYVLSCGFSAVYPDPESPSAIEEMRRRGINVREVRKGKDSIKSGIQRIRELLIANKVHINKRCVNLINELESYSYEDQKEEKDQKEKPIKFHDHALDALRYVILMRFFETPIPEYKQPKAEPSSVFEDVGVPIEQLNRQEQEKKMFDPFQ